MTTVYEDYYRAYDGGLFDINDVNFDCLLVGGTYVPDPAHKPPDVKEYILRCVGALTGDIIATKSMGDIVEVLRSRIEQDNTADIWGDAKYLVIEDAELEILCFCEEI